MIIVSQDKKELVKADRMENIWINIDFEGRFTIEATANTNTTLGHYKTEERAKEVLQEIITRYENWENMKMGQPSGICSPVYEMPED